MNTTQTTRQEMVVTLCKLLLDEDRLKILGLLAQQPCSAEMVAAQSGVERAKLHLHKLQEVGLVQPQQTAAGEFYAFNRQQFFQLKKLLFAREEAPEAQSGLSHKNRQAAAPSSPPQKGRNCHERQMFCASCDKAFHTLSPVTAPSLWGGLGWGCFVFLLKSFMRKPWKHSQPRKKS